jgi:hypothetical protein
MSTLAKTALEAEISDMSTRLIGISMQLHEPRRSLVLKAVNNLVIVETAMERLRELGYPEVITTS